jgi:hypothetical protein
VVISGFIDQAYGFAPIVIPIQTQLGFGYASVNLDFYGIGENSILKYNPLRYNFEPAGGTGFRYELARKYGLHMGVDLAFGPDDPIIYVQFSSAWMRS